MCLVEQTLNARTLTAVSDYPENLTALTPNHFLLGQENASAPLRPSSERYHDLRKSFKMAQAYANMIWKRWTREYLPQWNKRSKWSKEHVRNLKESELVWLVGDSLKRFEVKLRQIVEILTGIDAVVRSARVKMAHGELNQPVVKLAPLFYDGVSEIQNRAGDVGATSNQLQMPLNSKNSVSNCKNLSFCQNSKTVRTENFYKLQPKLFVQPPSDFWTGKPEPPEVMTQVRVTSKLLLDPTSVIASDQAVRYRFR